MDIKTPRSFETSDKAHADLFNDMLKTLLHNDTGISEQITLHINDPSQHSSEVEKKKWNESQLYKITGDSGVQLLNVPVGSKIFDSIKEKGTCTFYAPSGIEDSPSQYAIRGIQTVGQNNIGTGFAIDTAGNAYYFYYNLGHISITWTQLPTIADKDRWNNGQLYRLTENNGKPIYRGVSEITDYNEITDTGLYLIYNKGLNAPELIGGAFMIVISYGTTLLQTVYEKEGRKSYYRVKKTDSTWTKWTRVLTDDDISSTWNQVTLVAGTTIKHFAGNPLKFSIRLNTLHIRGSFEGVPANETVIARFTQKPSAKTVFVGATVGSYGAARFILDTDGSLRFDGMSANDNSYVSRFELNESIPLW
ncbi:MULTISPECIES: pyocin knob domain-containing protein [Bacillus]|uniref:pyocin knob domain-containing protein n=1 Tax=Bacillus TaxID=1386 RepID=UPI00042E8FBB|nr:pyocin knob domain-containing protein [Bacillus altitudinis]AHL72594.1 hypothetical protein BW16_14890 [Bacillus pumilus]KQL43123.1 hypothetical protein AN962_06180 [Bacillus sp. FJAT-21955]MDN0040628.1 pyocin knob domain-containing protein [Bacillus aerophilus]OQP19970.1 hypothetical protein B2I20_13585 [Bacillus stratosphericus]KJF47326.1 hypothetical protein BAIE_09900 [Bacillus altitudinis]